MKTAITATPPKREHRNPSATAQRRHLRDESIIDHLAREMFQPQPESPENAQKQSGTTETGLSVEEQVQKEWSPRNGGLPVF